MSQDVEPVHGLAASNALASPAVRISDFQNPIMN